MVIKFGENAHKNTDRKDKTPLQTVTVSYDESILSPYVPKIVMHIQSARVLATRHLLNYAILSIL